MELTWDWKIQSGTNSCCTIMPWQSDHKLNIDHLKQWFFSYHICRSRLSLIIHQNDTLVANYQSSHRIGRPFCVLFVDMNYRNYPTSWPYGLKYGELVDHFMSFNIDKCVYNIFKKYLIRIVNYNFYSIIMIQTVSRLSVKQRKCSNH